MKSFITESSLRERIDEVLSRVAKPARYMGGELNSVRKPPEEVSARVALAFPDVYEVGMSNLGLRILYHILNSEPRVAAERVFAPAPDMEAEMRSARIPLFSLESSLPVKKFDLVGFSLAYEMTFTTVLNMLDLAGIPTFARDRADGDPIIIAGGHCVTNPEPMADFIDAFAVGDGEEVALDLVRAYLAHCETRAEAAAIDTELSVLDDFPRLQMVEKRPKHGLSQEARARVLEAFSKIDGVYVPSVHGTEPALFARSTSAPHPVIPNVCEESAFGASEKADFSQARNDVSNAGDSAKPRVRSRVVRDFESAGFPDRLVVPFTETVHDRIALEIMRGCGRGCRFCHAGMITRPVRERSSARLIEQAETLLENTGYEEIALLSLSSADHSGIDGLVHALIDRYEDRGVGVSLPSLRADANCVRLAADIQRVRKSGLTFAPEAGTQRLRDVINKNVREEDLLEAVEAAVEAGWRRIKLYFMIGLPTETDEDLEGIGELVRKVLEVGRKHRKPLTLNITVSPFVPKPHTPFQWRPMESLEELERRIAFVRPLLKGKNIQLSWHDPRASRIEAALARGDRPVGRAIYEAWKRGANLEQDGFDYGRWVAAFETAGLDIAAYANPAIPRDAALAWDHIDVGATREFLAGEDEKAERGEVTPDCRFGECAGCGVNRWAPCVVGSYLPPNPLPKREGEHCSPPRFGEGSGERLLPSPPRGGVGGEVKPPRKLLFAFRKGPELKWIGHLDLLRVFERAVRMSGLEVVYTQGFNPRIKMSVASALPLGATADAELLTIHVAGQSDPKEALKRLNRVLPEGLSLTRAEVLPENVKGPVVTGSEFVVGLALPEGGSAEELERAIGELMDQSEILVERTSGGKRRTIDIRPGIESLEARGDQVVMRLPHREFTVKPVEVIEALSRFMPGIRKVSLHRSGLF